MQARYSRYALISVSRVSVEAVAARYTRYARYTCVVGTLGPNFSILRTHRDVSMAGFRSKIRLFRVLKLHE